MLNMIIALTEEFCEFFLQAQDDTSLRAPAALPHVIFAHHAGATPARC
jgi:hypothetical protein